MSELQWDSLNPYFIGLPILIIEYMRVICNYQMSQSLFYWITYSYDWLKFIEHNDKTPVSILILLDYLFLLRAHS